jgi:O-antigen/teichoic acid export membrane protein
LELVVSASNQLKKAILNSLLGKYSLYVFQIISVAVLSRLFSPEDFGIIAAAQVFAMFFQMLAMSGLGPAVVHQETVPANMRNGIFSFSLIIGLVLALIFLLSAETLFYWFGFDDGLIVFYTLVPCVFFTSLSMMPLASLQKDTLFLVIARAEIFAEICAFLICIVASFYFSGITALALKFLFVPVVRFIFYYIFSAQTTIGRPLFGREITQVVKLYNYAKYQVAFNILNFFAVNLDNILVAKYFGAASLGIYEKTYQVMRYPLILFTFAITPALQPVLTKYKNQPKIVFEAYFNIAQKLAMVGVFSATVIYWNAADIVFILFGDQWFATTPYLQILALSIPAQMVLSSTGGVYQAFGETKTMFYCGVFGSAMIISAVAYGIFAESLIVLCSLLVAAFTVNFIQCFIMLYRTVFVNLNVKKGIYLFLLVNFVLLNLFFDAHRVGNPSEIADSIISILVNSFEILVLVSLLFFTVKKLEL